MAVPVGSLTIENVVGTTNVGQELELTALAADLEGAQYDHENFPGLVYRLNDPHAAVLIFRSGKLVCTGAKSVDGLEQAFAITFQDLRELGIDAPLDPDVTIQNIVTSGDLGEPLALNVVAIRLGLEAVDYEPEQFPGLVYRLSDPEVVVLLFGSGKMVITGGTDPTDAEQAISTIHAQLTELDLMEAGP